MVTLSRTHACAIHNGKVIDTWDSRGGRVFGVLVKLEDVGEAIAALTIHGIPCERVSIPFHKVNRRRGFFRYVD